jgi:protein-S-isoprenylcysteine O-methyltransferase Ste14
MAAQHGVQRTAAYGAAFLKAQRPPAAAYANRWAAVRNRVTMSNFRWSNIPIPEGHVIFLVAGVALHVWLPLPLFDLPWLTHIVGWPLLLFGCVIVVWAVVAFQTMDFSNPNVLIDSGPYEFSRNPMYVAWTLLYLGIAAIVNSWWLIFFLPAVITFTHYFVVRREEQRLEQQFGEEYRQYRGRVRRYL